MVQCSKCGGELGLRERYERALDLIGAGLIVYNANNKLEDNPENPNRAKEVIEASVQMYNILKEYWNDIPGENLEEKLKNLDSKKEKKAEIIVK